MYLSAKVHNVLHREFGSPKLPQQLLNGQPTQSTVTRHGKGVARLKFKPVDLPWTDNLNLLGARLQRQYTCLFAHL